jgi:hypothetical protein
VWVSQCGRSVRNLCLPGSGRVEMVIVNLNPNK